MREALGEAPQPRSLRIGITDEGLAAEVMDVRETMLAVGERFVPVPIHNSKGERVVEPKEVAMQRIRIHKRQSHPVRLEFDRPLLEELTEAIGSAKRFCDVRADAKTPPYWPPMGPGGTSPPSRRQSIKRAVEW